MSPAVLLFSPLRLSRIPRIQLAFVVAVLVALTTACGSGGTAPPISKGNTSVAVLLSGAANDQLSQFTVTFSSIALISQTGKTVSLFAASDTPEFIHLNGTAEPLVTVSVPQDVYTSATATIQYSTFTCVSLLAGELQSSEFGPNGTLFATLTLPSPITVTGTAMGLLLNLQVSPSATFSNCQGGGATTDSITPTFNVTPIAISSQPTNVGNGKLSGIDGQISSVSTTGNSFSFVTADGIPLSINANGSTTYQGAVSELSAIVAGMPVDIDAAIQPDGSLLATRVGVQDADTTSLSVLSGPLLTVVASVPVMFTFGREQQGYLFPGLIFGGTSLSFGNAVFQTSGQFTNLQSLPFVASFDAANMFPGQNVQITTHAATLTPYPIYYPATSVTLIPQTINGTVSQVSSVGGFTTYTVTLAAYDLIASLAVQPGQTSVLTDPGTVVVYVDSSTQTLNTMPLAVGSVLRFNGLLFSDNGTRRMDCTQVNDGVAE
jgi:hypothetical protein